MPELMKIDPNAKTVDDEGYTILHWCAEHAWAEGVKYLMSREPKPDLTIKGKYGGNEFSRFVVETLRNFCSFEISILRFI